MINKSDKYSLKNIDFVRALVEIKRGGRLAVPVVGRGDVKDVGLPLVMDRSNNRVINFRLASE